MPFLAAALAALLSRILPGKLSCFLLVASVWALVGTPFKSAQALGLTSEIQTQYQPLLKRVKESLSPVDTLLTCRFKIGVDASTRVSPGNLSYYGSDGRPIYSISTPKDLWMQQSGKKKLKPPYRGLCKSQEFDELKRWLTNFRIVEHSNDYVHFESGPANPEPK